MAFGEVTQLKYWTYIPYLLLVLDYVEFVTENKPLLSLRGRGKENPAIFFRVKLTRKEVRCCTDYRSLSSAALDASSNLVDVWFNLVSVPSKSSSIERTRFVVEATSVSA